jgi:hypothetical protein
MSCGTNTVGGLYCHVWAQGVSGAFALGACVIGGVTIWRTAAQNHGHDATTKATTPIRGAVPERVGPNGEPDLVESGVRLQLRQSILRVLWMVPIYAATAWMSLMQKDAAVYWDLLRECYEAVAIVSFYQFLVAFLGGHLRATAHLADKYQARPFAEQFVAHAWPISRCARGWATYSGQFMRRTRLGILQYPALRVACAGVTFVLQHAQLYGNGTFNLYLGYPYIAFITNASQVRPIPSAPGICSVVCEDACLFGGEQVWAMYCLYQVYWAFHEEIQSIGPFAKFCCIKAVVFATFWQSVIIAALCYVSVVPSTQTYSQVSHPPSAIPFCVETEDVGGRRMWRRGYRILR